MRQQWLQATNSKNTSAFFFDNKYMLPVDFDGKLILCQCWGLLQIANKLDSFFFWPRLFQSKAHKSWTPTTINKCELRPEPSRISFVEEKALKQNKKKSCDTNTTVVYHHRCCRCFSKCTPTAEFKDYQMERKNE